MAKKFKGDIEVESGLGLPRLDTATREAYIPPEDGYIVFDTDIKGSFVWDNTGMQWIAIIFGDKIDVQDGVAKDSLTLNDASDTAALTLTNSTAASIIAVNDLTIGGGGSVVAFNSSVIEASAPILGIDSTDPASYITRNYMNTLVSSGKYIAAFVAADWVVSGTDRVITVDQATHGLTIVAGMTSYDVSVKQLSSGEYESVSIASSVNATTGTVTLRTSGDAFDGLIEIRDN